MNSNQTLSRFIGHFGSLTVVLLAGLVFSDPVVAMPGAAHDSLAIKLMGTPAENGGIGNMPVEKLQSINDWIDNPATRTGEFENHVTRSPVHPNNHGHLRHNPNGVGQVFSGDGSVDPAARNVARLHKIADVAHNHAGVDGYGKITAAMRREAQKILRYVEANGALPKNLPAWVDEAGPLSESGASDAAAASVLIRKVAGAVVVKGLGGLAVLDGANKVHQGFQDIQNGRPIEGALTLAGGASEATGGLAIVVNRFQVAGEAFGAMAVFDGAKDVYVGYRNDNGELVIIGFVKAAAGAAMLAGSATANPVLIVVGGVAYATVVVYENRAALESGLQWLNRQTRALAVTGAQWAGGACQDTAAWAKSAWSTTASWTAQTGAQAGQIAEQGAHWIERQAADVASSSPAQFLQQWTANALGSVRSRLP